MLSKLSACATSAQARCRGLLTRKRVRATRQRQARGGGGRAVEAGSGRTEGAEGAAPDDAEARHELLRGFEPLGMLTSCVAVARSKLATRGDVAVAEFDWLPANPQPNSRLCGFDMGFDMGFDCGLAARKPGAVVQVRTPRPHMLEAVRSLVSI